MVKGQDFCHHIYLFQYIYDKNIKTPMAVCLPVGWVLSGPLPQMTRLLSNYFKCKGVDVEFVSQVNAWCELESSVTYKQADARSAAD